MKKFLLAGAAVAAFAVSPALAQQAIVRGDSEQARSQVSQTAPTYQRTYGGYVANYGGPMAYAPQGYVATGPYAAAGGAFMAGPVDGPFNPGVSDQERTLYSQYAPVQGWPGGPQGGIW